MAKKKTNTPSKKKQVNTDNVIGLHSEVTAQPITETLETNYMPYAMSTNVSRAFPEIDGFKPSHRKRRSPSRRRSRQTTCRMP